MPRNVTHAKHHETPGFSFLHGQLRLKSAVIVTHRYHSGLLPRTAKPQNPSGSKVSRSGQRDLNPRHPVWAGVRLACPARFGRDGFRWNQADSGFWEVWLIELELVHRDGHRYHLVTVLVACGRGGASACRKGYGIKGALSELRCLLLSLLPACVHISTGLFPIRS